MRMKNDSIDYKADLLKAIEYQRMIDRIKQIDTKSALEETLGRIRKRERKTAFMHVFRKVAAVLLVPLLCSTIVLAYLSLRNSKPTFAASVIETVTPAGCRSRIVLPDGSIVWLNSGSRISYPNRFEGDSREVALEGEAFFKVKSDMKHPFYVNLSDKIKVMAHGTQFNISNYKHENTILMTLVSGAIDVYHGAKIQSALMPNEQCKYDRASGMFTNSAVNSTDYASWKDGKLVFHDTPLNVVLSQLSHRFNVKFRLHDRRRADYHVRATFENEDLHDMLQNLRSIIPIKWQDSPDMSGDNRRIIDLYID